MEKYDGIKGEGTSIATALWVAETYGVCEDKLLSE